MHTDLETFTDDQIEAGMEHMLTAVLQGCAPREAALRAADRVVPTHRGTWRPWGQRVTRHGNFFRRMLESYNDAHADSAVG